jgi:hypothetical protein
MSERIQGLKSFTFDVKDQAGDDREIMFKLPSLPGGYDLVEASITLHAGTSADGSNFVVLTIQDAGTDGTGTSVMASRGGASVAWAADGVYDLTLAGGVPYPITGGDWVALDWAETGTWAMVGTLTAHFAPGQQGT